MLTVRTGRPVIAVGERVRGMRSFTLGQISEIDIRLHPTFAVVLLWVAVDWRRIGGEGGSLLYGLLFVLLVFGCVLLHELGHALMARQYGVPVRDITLSAIGGVARMAQAPQAPRTEALVALAGPAVSLALATLLLPWASLVAVVAGWAGLGEMLLAAASPSIGGLLVGLVGANVMLAVFNLLPIFPMDGGRVLRAGLSAALGRERGTRLAVWAGQGLAAVLGLVALVWLHSLILPLIAVFVAVMAHAEGKAVRIESALRRMRVGQFALWDMGGVSPAQPLAYALRGGPRDVVVTEQGRVVGMLWRNEVLAAIGKGGAAGRSVADVMDADPVTADVDDSVFDVQRRLDQAGRWAIPVTENGLYRGVFTVDRLQHVYRQIVPGPLPAPPEQGWASWLAGWWRAVAR